MDNQWIIDYTTSQSTQTGQTIYATTTYFYVEKNIQNSTSSPAQMQTNLFFGVVLFILVASLIVGYFTIKFKK